MFDEEPRKKKRYNPAEALLKISHYCAYQERSHKEVRNKLYEYGLHKNDVEEVISKLITDGFLNEERFAKAFAGGKFRIKKWGRNKIVHELEALGVTPRCIRTGLQSIDESDYKKALKDLLKKKFAQTVESNTFKKRDKVARFAIAKGYEPDAVWEILKGTAAD
jgi:regulatory protein